MCDARIYDFHLSNLYEPPLLLLSIRIPSHDHTPHPLPRMGYWDIRLNFSLRIWYSRMSNRCRMRYCWGGLINMSMREFSVILFRLRCLCAKVLVFPWQKRVFSGKKMRSDFSTLYSPTYCGYLDRIQWKQNGKISNLLSACSLALVYGSLVNASMEWSVNALKSPEIEGNKSLPHFLI